PSRLLAAEYGCKVTGLDLTEAYCDVAQMLAARLGLGGLVDYRQGDALALPFDDGQFDVVWSQHAAMNIADKARLYSEMTRVLKPGGTVAIYDILAGSGGPVIFPVPWAREPAISFLAEPAEWRRLLEGQGLEVIHWRDTTALGRDWFRGVVERNKKSGPSPLGFQVLLGPGFAQMAQNQLLNLEQDRVVLIETVCRKR
ncbi:MAG: methyltransferase domain-containing protein, partial [bacterium]